MSARELKHELQIRGVDTQASPDKRGPRCTALFELGMGSKTIWISCIFHLNIPEMGVSIVMGLPRMVGLSWKIPSRDG